MYSGVKDVNIPNTKLTGRKKETWVKASNGYFFVWNGKSAQAVWMCVNVFSFSPLFFFQVWSCIYILWYKSEHNRVWAKPLPHTVYICIHWNANEDWSLFLLGETRSKILWDGSHACHWTLSLHQHFYFKRSFFLVCLYLICYMKLVDFYWIYSLFFSVLPTDKWLIRTIVAVLGKSMSEASFTIMYLYTTELYPTVVRLVNKKLIDNDLFLDVTTCIQCFY